MKIILMTTMVIRISHHIMEILYLYYHIKLFLSDGKERL